MLFVFSAIINVKYVPYCKCNRRLVFDVKLYTYYIYIFLVYFVKKYTLGVSMETGTHRVSFQRGNKAWPPGDQSIRVPVLEKTKVAWV